jgi:hypothetical protein
VTGLNFRGEETNTPLDLRSVLGLRLETSFAMYEVDSKNLKTSLFPTLPIP